MIILNSSALCPKFELNPGLLQNCNAQKDAVTIRLKIGY